MPKIKKKFHLISFEDASILRKFTILFLITSIVPMALLYYFYYTTTHHHGRFSIPQTDFTYALILMILGIFIGFITIRSLFVQIITISKQNRKTLQNLLSPQTMHELDQSENEITTLSRSFSAVTKRLEENIRSLELARKTLNNVMTKVSQGISNMENIDTFLDLILETVTHALNGRSAALMLLNDKKTELTVHTVYGAAYDTNKKINIKLFENSPLSQVLTDKKSVNLSGVFLHGNNPALGELFGESLICAPLLYNNEVKGLLTLSRPGESREDFSEKDTELICNLATQTAVAIENSKLNQDIERTYFETLCALALAVDAKDQYSHGHLDRVANYAVLIGKHLGLDEADIGTLRDASRLHDLGKVGIPIEILKKDARLTDEEWVIMRRHPEIGESIIRPVRSLQHLCDPVRHHHERLDGSGYPDGLKREEISPLTRILSVADAYDSLTTERPYRPKKSKEEAIGILRSMKKQLDQDIVDILVENLNSPQESLKF